MFVIFDYWWKNNNNKLFYKDTEYFMSTRQLYDWKTKPITNANYNKTLIFQPKVNICIILVKMFNSFKIFFFTDLFFSLSISATLHVGDTETTAVCSAAVIRDGWVAEIAIEDGRVRLVVETAGKVTVAGWRQNTF